jgi:hypothetical protein
MSTITWTKNANGFWGTGANWSSGTVPGASDNAFITGFLVESIANFAVGGVFLSNASLIIDSNTTFSTVIGTVAANATIDNSGTLTLGKDNANDTISDVGEIVLHSQSTLKIAGGVGLSGNQSQGDSALRVSGSTVITGDGNGPATLTLSHSEIVCDQGAANITNLTLDIEGADVVADQIGASIVIATGNNAIILNNGFMSAQGGGEIDIDSPLNQTGNGVFVLSGGRMRIAAAASVTGGAIQAEDFGIIELATGGSISGTLQFFGPGTTLQLDTATSQVAGATITGVVSDDVIDLAFQPFASGYRTVWQQANSSGGTLFLVSGNSTLAALNLQGQYTSSFFSPASDGKGGTQVNVRNPGTPFGTSADMIMSDGISHEIYNIGNNTVISAYELEEFTDVGAVAVVGIGGFNGNDVADMLIRSTTNGALFIAEVSKNNVTNNTVDGLSSIGTVGLSWQVRGFGDFSSQPNETDMMMRDVSSGGFEVYNLVNGAIGTTAFVGNVGLDWSVSLGGFGDFNTVANETDMLLRNTSTGAFEVYDITNNSIVAAMPMRQVGLEWEILGFGGFSSNANETDMIMRNKNNGQLELYDIRNNAIASATALGQIGLEWQAAGVGTLNFGTADLLMRNSQNGAFEVYDIAHNQIATAASMGQVGLNWQVDGIATDLGLVNVPLFGTLSNDATAQLAQAMAGFGGGNGAGQSLNSAPLGLDTSQQPLLTTPQHA